MLRLVAVRSLARILVVAWAAVTVAAGCGGVTLQPTDGGSNAGRGGDAGGSSGGPSGSAGTSGAGGTVGSCDTLDEMTCTTRRDCTSQFCSVCPNQSTFAGCTALGAPPVACPAEACVQPSCGTLAEASCKARSDCSAQYCPDCMGGQTFTGCAVQGSGGACPPSCPQPPGCDTLDEAVCKTRSDCHPGYCANCSGAQVFTLCVGPNEAVACPGYACPAPASCASVADEATCDARSDCHSVFIDPGTCGCAAVGCCAHFVRCADGAKTSCTGTPVCQTMTPFCDAPAFVVSYTASCYEGCVRPSECGP
jgi:hypothetical protein